MKYITRFVLYTLLGWKTKGHFPKDLKKYLLIAAPHTHWLDFPLGMAVKWAEGLPANYIGKASLFEPPFGFFFRWLGGAPVVRNKKSSNVEAIVNVFNSRDKFVLGMSPEGARKKVKVWKIGFYYIAKGANIPIVMATLNFEHKEVKISEPFYLTDDMEADLQYLTGYFKGVKGKIPEYS